MTTRPFALIACLALLAACGSDDPTAPGAVSGTVTFNYSGAGGGTYSATGALAQTASDVTAQTTTWGTGWKDNTDGSLNVASNIATTSTLSNFLAIVVNRQTVGTATIDPNCVSTNTTSCTDFVFFVALASSGSANFICALDAGSVVIATVTSERATGTFSGTGTCVDNAGGEQAFAVTNGSFDVPLLSSIPGAVGLRS